ncbi:pyridoxal phosphate-dependent aminotransferase [Pseudonocardia eucalypti]|uniref:cysteine-S-conjugate beta-lyase n=1 Tax=Pseudonocardia eucalypti TaxID=648755 RepID=A0ABP9RG10_9PSEU|nr:cystathionine beta-lyase [Pseudonocardia eucalypti]
MSTTTTQGLHWDSTNARARGCKRWSEYPPEVLDLGVAEMDVSACPPVLEAVRDAVAAEALGYPLPDSHSKVPPAAAAWLSGLGLSVRAEHIRVVPDVMRGISVALHRLTRPGSPVVIPTPAYPRFFEAAALVDREHLEAPLRLDENGWRLDLEAIEHGLARGAGSVLLCNPVNPVGAVIGPDQLRALAELVDRHGARVITDEVHAPLRFGAGFTPYAAISPASRAHTVTVTSATKAWNFPGLRTAVVALTAPEDRTVWDGLAHLETSGASSLGEVATVAALEHGQPWLAAVLRDLDANRRLVSDLLERAGLRALYQVPDATYFAWLDLRAWDDRPAARLLDSAKVATGEGVSYGRAGTGFVRLNLATEPQVLTEAVTRITAALNR